MKKYTVTFDIEEDVDAENPEEAVQAALSQMASCDYYLGNDITDYIERHATVTEIEEEED